MALPAVLAPLKHRDFAYLIASFGVSFIGAWTYNVALTVWLIDATGSPSWVAVATVARFVPSLLLSAYGGVLADRLERVRLMMTINLGTAGIMGLMAVEMALDAPPALVVITAALSSVINTAYEPAAAAITPQLVSERDLGQANTLRNTLDNICVIAGPGFGALLLLLGDPAIAVIANGVLMVGAALLTGRIRVRSTPVDVTDGGEAGALKQMTVGIRTILSSGATATLVGFCLIVTGVYGMDTVLFVILSRDRLGTGAEGFGYLLAGLGIGGILAAGLVARLEKLPRLGVVIWLGTAGYCVPTILFLFVDQPAAAFAIQVFRGGSTLVVDVLAITALQRGLPNEVLARVFGAFNALVLAVIIVGSTIVPLIVNTWGLNAALWFSGPGVPALCLLLTPWLRKMDAEAAARREQLAPWVAILEACDLFGKVSPGALEQLAGAATQEPIAAGTLVITDCEPADAFYVVISGSFVARTQRDGATVELSAMGPGDYFGEIGLIESTPRTAEVLARTDGELLRVDGTTFVDALTEAAPSVALLDGASLRLRRTHGTALTRSALADES